MLSGYDHFLLFLILFTCFLMILSGPCQGTCDSLNTVMFQASTMYRILCQELRYKDAAAAATFVSDSVRPNRRQPTRLPRPWDSPGKNTGVGCHCLLQCRKVKVKLLSYVQLFATPWTAAYQAPLSMGFSRQEYWSGLPFP